MRAKRDTEIAEVNANVVREGEEFVYTVDRQGLLQLVTHKPTFQTMGNPIVGAYAVVVNKDNSTRLEVMTMDMIQKAWNQGGFGDRDRQTGAHKNFTDQMCKKTVIARACKVALESVSDRDDDDSPNAETVEATAQASDSHPQAKAIEHHDDFEQNADYEEVEPTQPDYGAMGNPDDTKRQCPL